jgi:hypothetical protein
MYVPGSLAMQERIERLENPGLSTHFRDTKVTIDDYQSHATNATRAWTQMNICLIAACRTQIYI